MIVLINKYNLTEKTESLYDLVMQLFLATVATEIPGDQFKVEIMISDHEDAILNSMKTTFPKGRERGCWFHFGQVDISNCLRTNCILFLTTFPVIRIFIDMH